MTKREAQADRILNSLDVSFGQNYLIVKSALLAAMQWQAEQCVKLGSKEVDSHVRLLIISAGTEEA